MINLRTSGAYEQAFRVCMSSLASPKRVTISVSETRLGVLVLSPERETEAHSGVELV
jgi:hypothetical protein